jgi:hypothetical protein
MIHRKLSLGAVVPSVVFFLATLFISSPLLAANPKIDLTVGEVEGQPKLLFTSTACPSGKLGEICVAKGSKVFIMWELDKDSNDKGWDLSGLRLSWSDDVPVDCVVEDFNVDPQTGEALDFQVQPNGRDARNRDDNNCAEPYVVNYTISATHRDRDMTIDSDPVIRNGGRN